MATTSRISTTLQPYLTIPAKGDLVMLTSILGANSNWLVVQHLHSLLKPPPPFSPFTRASTSAAAATTTTTSSSRARQGEGQDDDDDDGKGVAVVLVSFLRDFSFWREGLAKLGLDLEAAARRGKFGYVDGLSCGLFAPAPNQNPDQGAGDWKRTVTSPLPVDVKHAITQAVEQLERAGEEKVVVMVDGMDFLLAASADVSIDVGPGTALGMKHMLLKMRRTAHAVVVALSADDPLIKVQETILEKQHSWFAMGLAHEADKIFSLRLLDTGAARDVSGVIRITHRGVSANEYLYHVGNDGGVRVFERGQQ